MSDVIRPARDAVAKADTAFSNLPIGSRNQVNAARRAINNNLKELDNITDPVVRQNLEAEIAEQTATLRRLIGDTTVGKPSQPFAVVDSANNIREIGENVLSDYINVQYHVALTMLSFDKAAKVQSYFITGDQSKPIDLNTMIVDQREDKSVTLASTGEVFRNRQNATLFGNRDIGLPRELTGDTSTSIPVADVESTFLADPRNYYNITDMVMENIMSPSTANPSISQMCTLKMRISEPSGFKFVEDIKRLAFDVGYRFVNHSRAIYRVDLWFSGYKMSNEKDTTVPIGTWVDNIPIYNDYTGKKQTVTPISYYCVMTKAEAELTANGTVYDVDLVPLGGASFRPEDTVLDVATLKSHKGQILTTGTIGQFLDSLQTVLPLMRKDSSNNRIKREYKFYAPQWIRDAQIGGTDSDRLSTTLGSLDGSKPSGAPLLNSGRGTTVIDILNMAFADSPNLRELWLADGDDNKGFLTPRIHMSIRFNAKYYSASDASQPPTSVKVDKDLNDFDKITLEYLIEPYITFKSFTSDNPDKVTETARPENQLQRVKNLIKYGMLTRIYNYIWTGLNTEILDLQLRFKMFYFVSLWKGSENGGATRGRLSGSPAANPYADTNKLIGDAGVNALIKQLFGDQNRIQEASKLFDSSNPYSIFNMGSMNTGPDVDPMLSQTSNKSDLAKYLYYEHDHFENDLLTLEGMNIKGDPIWLLSSYASAQINPLKGEPAKSGDNEVKIQPQGSRVIFLRVNVPQQDDYMNANFFANGVNKHPHIIGGFYEVYKVTSTFAGGRFTQKLEGAKIANLNFVEELFQIGGKQVYLRAADPSVLGGPDEGRPTPVQTSGPGGPTDQIRGIPGADPSRPLTAAEVAAADAYFNRTDPNMSSANLSREQKILVARQFFIAQGCTDAQANAIVGNLIGESQMNTSALNKNDGGPGKDSVGIMQWNRERLTGGGGYIGLFPYAQTQPNKNPYDLLTQLNYAWQERNGPERSGWNAALGAANQTEMTQVFMRKVERPLVQTFSTDRDSGAKLSETLGQQATNIRKSSNLAGYP